MNEPQPATELRGLDTVVVAASAGGLDALRALVSQLPPDLPASILVAMHIPSSGRTALPRILERSGPLSAHVPTDGEPLEYGRIYVAPPDQHLIVAGGRARLSRAPRQHGHRPAADPLFCSAAVEAGSHALGIVLSGTLDDGTAGSVAVRRCSGQVVVQDPEAAAYSDMPRNVLQASDGARAMSLDELAAFVAEAARITKGPEPGPPEDLIRGVELFIREVPVRLRLARLAPPAETTSAVAVVVDPDGSGASPAQTIADDEDGTRLVEPGSTWSDAQNAVWGATCRLQVMTRLTRLLLDEESLREPVALNRAAWLLRDELADWALVDLIQDGHAHRAVVAGGDGDARTNVLDVHSPTNASALQNVLETGSSTLHPSIEDESVLGFGRDDRPLLTVLNASSLLCVPIRDRGEELLGTVTLIRESGRDAFGMADLGLMEEVGEHLGQAMRIERRYQRSNEEAKALQASLLPRSPLSIPGVKVASVYRPATEGVEIGGDFYDVFKAGEGFGFVLGDVCGKGEQAAMVAAAARNWIQLLGLSHPEPADVLRQVNHGMLAHQGSDRFITALAGRLWIDHRTEDGTVRVRVSSAGHPQAALLRAGGAVSFLDGGGQPLGIFEDASTASEDVDLGSGDTLLLYSDGVTETRGADGELYGPRRLADVLARSAGSEPGAIIKEVENELKAHSSGRSHDDVAMLAFQVRDPGDSDKSAP